ncbi:unnamed protein product [Rotaria sp. Silwood2]|nr:unnamed protein product [Rotaria sp. Silwood2]CAF2730897.1 unnamed protein product [Rotaria sp. Silwood2]CAF2966977.1 unnamed protein product [Rotaria sp. Silwood2]CAF3111138.1 unnamed protein product [Rotaria sp. Silwood2]CAF4008855.1 unnamed protein product [Rotaria sp. Silwood2]
MAAMEFDDVYEEIRGVLNPGRLKLTSNSVVFKNLRTGKVETITKDEIENIKWMRRSRGYGLKFITKNDSSLRYDGFKDTDIDRLKEFMTINFGKNVETQKMAVNGWNWGKVSFGAGNLAFQVDHKQAFEVPLKNVSNSNKGKNEITLQFHQADDAKVSLMEIRFYVPPGDVDGDPVEDFHQNVMRDAAVLTAKAGDAICSLSDINCLVPRGRHELRFYPSFFDLHGKSYDYKIPYNQITRGFLLPHKDNRQMYFVLSLDPPVKHGQTRYQYIIFGFKKEEETKVELSLSLEVIQEKYGNNLHKEMQGPYHDIVSRLFRAITEQRITVPGSFTSGAKCVGCSYKASAGLLYPLERGFIYITKPPIYIHHDDVASCGFNRSNTTTGRTCDFEIQLKSGGSHVFSNIEKEEAKPMSDFLSSKDLRIHAASNWDKKINYTVDKDRDIYLEHVQNEGQEREDEDDESDDEEEDEDFEGGEEEEDALEYDSEASIHSTEDEDEDGSKSPSSSKKRKKSEASSTSSKKKSDESKKKSDDSKKKSDESKKKSDDPKKKSDDSKKKSDDSKNKSDDSKKKTKQKESPNKKPPKSKEQIEDDSD